MTLDVGSGAAPSTPTPTGTGYVSTYQPGYKFNTQTKKWEPPAGGTAEGKNSAAVADPYWASQAAAAGYNPNAAKLPPGPVIPKVADRKLFDTVHSQNQRTAARAQAKSGSRSTHARLGTLRAGSAISYAPRGRKPRAPSAK